ncbi:rhodanese-like domain-containing protein [Cryptosporangium japonicum]|uniref:Rhodanese-like domain-containing protein n=1 Tax=Cryptosporangium japonicum TaxID=80872 RepID=A0ABN0V7D0_9ACTN
MVQPSIPADVPDVTPDSLGDDIYLLDVREQDEWDAGHAPHAHHIPMYEIPQRLAEVPTVGDVVVVCRVGGRSAQVAAYLAAQGWENVANLDGGMLAWERSGRAVVADTGLPARVL